MFNDISVVHVRPHLGVVGSLVLTHRGREECREGGELDRMNRMYGIDRTVGCLARSSRRCALVTPPAEGGMPQHSILCAPGGESLPTLRHYQSRHNYFVGTAKDVVALSQ